MIKEFYMDKHTRLNYIFSAMKKRCYDSNCKSFKNYGGRGITVCNEWLNPERTTVIGTKAHHVTKGFVAFKEWALANGYSDNLTLDRIDVNKGYSPDNCRWTTVKEQQNNTRKNVLVTYKGETKTLSQWCEELKLNYFRMRNRICLYHWSPEKAFETTYSANERLITYNGKRQSVVQWCNELNLSIHAVRNRLRRGWSVEAVFETKQRRYN